MAIQKSISLLRRLISLDLYSYSNVIKERRRSRTFVLQCNTLALFMVLGFITIYNIYCSNSAFALDPETTITMTIGKSTASVDLTVTDVDGTFAASSHNAEFSVSTTNGLGYILNMYSTSSNTSLINTDGTTYEDGTVAKFSPISTDLTQSQFDVAANNGKWGYSLYAGSTAPTNLTYRPGPDNTGVTLDTVTTPGTVSYTIGLGVRADYTQPTGAYSNSYILQAVGKVVPYTITYLDNSGESEDMPSATTGEATNTTTDITLASTTPTRDGYTFEGWCSVTTTDDSCAGTTYPANGTFPLAVTASDASASENLYAMWAEDDPCVKSSTLYCAVAGQSRGAFDIDAINDELTTDNSGVYLYNGEHSDNADDYRIYFYRGIIDASYAYTGSYGEVGSSGDGGRYPNFVKLTTGDNITCWRIFRTTGSGGVKMIYNGIWADGSCANAMGSVGVTDAYYNRASDFASKYCYDDSSSAAYNAYCGTIGFVTYAGYNYNSTYQYNNTRYTTAVRNSILFNNGAASNIRTKVESWYNNVIGSSNNGLFETNAGYCNDRSTPGINTGGTDTTTVPYKKSNAEVQFGAYQRIYSSSPSLSCPNITNLDLLNGYTGKSYPVALITADEAMLSGNGRLSGTYASESFLTSGRYFWTLSPQYRVATGHIYISYISSNGVLGSLSAAYSWSVRPVVSLAPGTTIKSGSGTAADPWIVQD